MTRVASKRQRGCKRGVGSNDGRLFVYDRRSPVRRRVERLIIGDWDVVADRNIVDSTIFLPTKDVVDAKSHGWLKWVNW